MESRLYACPRYGKDVKSTSGLTRYVNACKILITLPSCQPSKPTVILEDNITNCPDLPLDKEVINLGASNYGKEEIIPINKNDDKIRPANIDQQRPITPNWIPQNGLLKELFRNFKEVSFSEFKFPISIPVSNTRYEHSESQNNNLFYLFNDQLDYALTTYFAKSETTKYNVDKFLSNPLMKLITKKLSYCNVDKWTKKLFIILWEILNNK